MGKKLTVKVEDQSQGVNASGVEGISDRREIIDENTELLQNNTTARRSRRPSPSSNGKSQQISKNRKLRVYNPDDRFLNEHIKRYYLFPFYYSTLFPYFKISWKVWKPNSVYKKMAQYLSNIPDLPNKTPIQCKSFDQRMKDMNYVSQPDKLKVDLFEAAVSYLNGIELKEEDKEVIDRYVAKMEEKGGYMKYLQEQGFEEEWSESVEDSKKHSEPFVTDEKKEETSIESHMLSDLIFNEFLDIGK